MMGEVYCVSGALVLGGLVVLLVIEVLLGVAFYLLLRNYLQQQETHAREREDLYSRLQAGTLQDYEAHQEDQYEDPNLLGGGRGKNPLLNRRMASRHQTIQDRINSYDEQAELE